MVSVKWSAKLKRSLLSLLLVVVVLVAALTAFAPAAAAGRSVGADRSIVAILNGYLSSDLQSDPGFIVAGNLKTELGSATPPFLVDVRPTSAYNSGHIAGAVNIPIGSLIDNRGALPEDQPIVVYCTSDHLGAQAMMALRLLGYTSVKSLLGGLNAWKAAGLTTTTS